MYPKTTIEGQNSEDYHEIETEPKIPKLYHPKPPSVDVHLPTNSQTLVKGRSNLVINLIMRKTLTT